MLYRAYPICWDRYEPNDTPTEAALLDPIPLLSPIQSGFCGSDPDDYFKFELTGTKSLQMRLFGIAPDSDLDLFVYGQDLVLKVWSNAGGLGQEEKLCDSFDAGTYYIRIYPYALPHGFASSGYVRTYGLEISEPASCPTRAVFGWRTEVPSN